MLDGIGRRRLQFEPQTRFATVQDIDKGGETRDRSGGGVAEADCREFAPTPKMHRAVRLGGAVQRRIVQHDHVAIGRKPDIDLHLVHTEGDRSTAGEQAIFRPEKGAAAMGDDLWK